MFGLREQSFLRGTHCWCWPGAVSSVSGVPLLGPEHSPEETEGKEEGTRLGIVPPSLLSVSSVRGGFGRWGRLEDSLSF